MGIGAAIIGSAIVGAGASVAASKSAKKSQQAASRQVKKGVDQSVAEQRRQFDTMLELTQPRRDAETAAVGQLLNILGLGDSPVDMTDINIPGQDFAINEASRAIERSAAARGGLASGNTLAALQDRAQGIASQNFLSHYLAPLQAMALGPAGAQAGTAAMSLGVNVGNTITSGASQRANLAANTPNAWSGVNNAIQGGLSNYLLASNLGYFGGGSNPSLGSIPTDTAGALRSQAAAKNILFGGGYP